MTESKPMDKEYEERLRGYLDGDLQSDPPWDGRDGMEAALAYVLRAHDHWRSRSPVTDDDVRERGIDYDKALATWREHNTEEPFFDGDDPAYMDDDDKVAWMCNAAVDQWAALDAYASDCAIDDDGDAGDSTPRPSPTERGLFD